MIKIRKSADRGHAEHGWLDSYHTFSFADYHDPEHVGFRDLLVINEDRIVPAEGFGTHGHRDMEIVTYVLDGKLEHKDSLGTGSVLTHGDVQRMSAGTGVRHSEFNGSNQKPVHLLQIWIAPAKNGIRPDYEEKRFTEDSKKNRLKLIVSPDGKEGSLRIHQDASIYASILEACHEARLELGEGRHAWVQLARGSVELNGVAIAEGDGAAVSGEQALRFKAQQPSEFLVFDLR
jgi:redox-sensitive bicupin YhaK (pirin superfamily)